LLQLHLERPSWLFGVTARARRGSSSGGGGVDGVRWVLSSGGGGSSYYDGASNSKGAVPPIQWNSCALLCEGEGFHLGDAASFVRDSVIRCNDGIAQLALTWAKGIATPSLLPFFLKTFF